MKADRALQFDLRAADPPPKPPQWLTDFLQWLEKALKPVARFFRWLDSLMPDAPYAKIFLWSVIALLVAALLWIVYQRIRHGAWRLPRRSKSRSIAVEDEEPDWAPDTAQSRAWLAEADALAAQGRFAEAAHHLLFRSIEDLAKRRPELARPALTSRELAAAPIVPPVARELFGRIARLVERSLFGGRSVDADDWGQARAAYSDFALPRAWAA